jgi:hypothetical protein
VAEAAVQEVVAMKWTKIGPQAFRAVQDGRTVDRIVVQDKWTVMIDGRVAFVASSKKIARQLADVLPEAGWSPTKAAKIVQAATPGASINRG